MKRVLDACLVLMALLLCTGATAVAQIAGGYKSASTTDERVVAAARFAVRKRSEEAAGLTLVSIEKAEIQVVAGTNFRLCLKVSLDGESREVKAVVFQNLKQKYSLTSWTVEDCGESQSRAAQAVQRAANCRGEQLSLREAEGEADMGGKRYGNFIFTNTSSNACSLLGFPKFALLNRAGKPLRGVAVRYDDEFPNRGGGKRERVTLEPGQTAWFQIYYNDGMALQRKRPFPVSAKVRVIVPNTTRAFVLNSRIQACCGVQVSSIRNGTPQ